MSRQELADAINEYLADKSAPDGPIDRNQIGRLERGLNTWPRAPRRTAFRAVLGASTDAELGFYNIRRPRTATEIEPAATTPATIASTSETDPVGSPNSVPASSRAVARRHQALVPGAVPMARRGALLAGIAAVAAASGLLGRESRPGRIGMADVGRVHAVTALYRSVDYECGGGSLYADVGRFAEATSELLYGSYTGPVRSALLAAVAEARQLAGWTAFDAGRLADAQRHWLSAERAAVTGGNVRLAARVRYCQARQFQHQRHNRDAVETLRLAREQLGTAATPAITAMINGAEAASLAALGQYDTAHALLASALDAFERIDHEREPHWMSFFDRGEILAQYGRVYRDMARQHPRYGEQAVAWTSQAIASFGPQNVRSTVLNEIGLCSALFLAGEVDDALTVGASVLPRVDELTSARIVDRVRNLRRDLEHHHANSAVGDFSHAISTIRPTGA